MKLKEESLLLDELTTVTYLWSFANAMAFSRYY